MPCGLTSRAAALWLSHGGLATMRADLFLRPSSSSWCVTVICNAVSALAVRRSRASDRSLGQFRRAGAHEIVGASSSKEVRRCPRRSGWHRAAFLLGDGMPFWVCSLFHQPLDILGRPPVRAIAMDDQAGRTGKGARNEKS